MHLYYMAVHFEDKAYMGSLKEIGFWEHYYVYEIEDHVLSRVDLLRVRPVMFPSKHVAMGWLFATAQTDAVKVHPDTYASEHLAEIDSTRMVPHTKGRVKYTLNEQDVQNGAEFAKLVLHEKVDRDYENMWIYTKPQSFSRLLSDYVTYVKASGLPADPQLQRLYDAQDYQYAAMKKVVDALYDTHVMIEQIDGSPAANAVLLHHFNQINNLPTILRDAETNNVQRTVKS